MMLPNKVAPAEGRTQPQVILAGMRTGSTLLASRLVGAVSFHHGVRSASSAQEVLHPSHLAQLVARLGVPDAALREQGPMALLERVWSEHGPCPVKIMPSHFLRACWRFQCEMPPGAMFARWIAQPRADVVLLRRRNVLAQVASAVRAETERNFDRSARAATDTLALTPAARQAVATHSERIGFDDTLLSCLPGIRVFYESLCECGFEHAALPGTERAPLTPRRDYADVGHTFAGDDIPRFKARARAGLARGRIRAIREVFAYMPGSKMPN